MTRGGESPVVAMFGLASVPAVVSAQVCRGYPALADSTMGRVGVNASFADNDRLTIRPSASIPIAEDDEGGDEGGDTVFNVGVAIGLGG